MSVSYSEDYELNLLDKLTAKEAMNTSYAVQREGRHDELDLIEFLGPSNNSVTRQIKLDMTIDSRKVTIEQATAFLSQLKLSLA